MNANFITILHILYWSDTCTILKWCMYNVLIWRVWCRLPNNRRLNEEKAAAYPLAPVVTRVVTQFGNGLIDSSPFRPDGASHYRAQVPLLSNYSPLRDRRQYQPTLDLGQSKFISSLIVHRIFFSWHHFINHKDHEHDVP